MRASTRAWPRWPAWRGTAATGIVRFGAWILGSSHGFVGAERQPKHESRDRNLDQGERDDDPEHHRVRWYRDGVLPTSLPTSTGGADSATCVVVLKRSGDSPSGSRAVHQRGEGAAAGYDSGVRPLLVLVYITYIIERNEALSQFEPE